MCQKHEKTTTNENHTFIGRSTEIINKMLLWYLFPNHFFFPKEICNGKMSSWNCMFKTTMPVPSSKCSVCHACKCCLYTRMTWQLDWADACCLRPLLYCFCHSVNHHVIYWCWKCCFVVYSYLRTEVDVHLSTYLNPFLMASIILFLSTGVWLVFCIKFMPIAALMKTVHICWLHDVMPSSYCDMYELKKFIFSSTLFPEYQWHRYLH
jgi:hypothetical protein